MNQLIDFFKNLFDSSDWPPRWHCGRWTEFHGWFYIVSDLLVWSAYFTIPLIIIKYITKKHDAQFIRLYFLFAAFILACGSTHFLDAIAFWIPVYRLNALVRFITGVLSWLTVFYLAKFLPIAFSLKSQRELEEEIEQRKNLEKDLKKSNSELEAFTYSVSHDLRAPLRGIIGYTSILEEDYNSKLDDEGRRVTSLIKHNTLKMAHLIDALLSFSRLGRQDIVKNDINSNEMVKMVIEELTDTNKDISIEWVVHDLPRIKGDINAMQQVWINLLSNAIKYSRKKEHPYIEIGSFMEEDQLVLFVRDNGVGFDEQYKDKLFKVFQRLHSEDEFEGTGVGLAIVEKIISKHRGKIWAEAKPNKGATFYFYLPDK